MRERCSAMSLAMIASAAVACSASHDAADAQVERTDALDPTCGTLGAPCVTTSDCETGQACTSEAPLDAGPRAHICIDLGFAADSCGGWSGTPCADPTDMCVASPGVSDVAFCFSMHELRCVCRSELGREVLPCHAL
jgi:hypothetical protein